ncbi:SusE domain-containing protein [Hymenobacter cellulosivorans]|uniref:SusE domain-containing protein n=1 Tax=Hymenobacter cellulosivorans TaxID=2932249 RepID=A0ABY4F3X3_9BACT|nr:SusE domain-containing protein [Hymenobacter cellulosivorans]UOQ50990.1 SusE domain-containing protein [Hymenobacter cellulosivorans]
MNNWLTRIVGLCAAVVVVTSCEKDETKAVLNTNSAPQLTATTAKATISPTTGSQPAVTYTWTNPDFGYQAAVSYTLQFAKKGTNFKPMQEFEMGSSLTKSFTVNELNSVYNGLDCNITAPVATTLDVRVKATLGGTVEPIYSSLTSIEATPFQAQSAPADSWAIIGEATPNGWNTETRMSYDYCSRVWSVTLPLKAGEFKFRANNGWDKNLGDEGTGDPMTTGRKLVYNVAPTPNPSNIKLATAGTYLITLDINATPNPIFKLSLK